MSQENVEIIERLTDAFNEGGMGGAAALGLFDAGIVFEEPPEQPSPTVAVGLDEVARTFGAFDEMWESHRSEPEELRVLDDGRILLLTVEHFLGRDGIEVSQPCGTIFTLLNEKVTRMQPFWDRATALEAVTAPS
jgi:ketosteroid isomerase-like protein